MVDEEEEKEERMKEGERGKDDVLCVDTVMEMQIQK